MHFKKALFVPNISVYYKVGSHALPSSNSQVDLSWQLALQRVWENLIQGEKGIILCALDLSMGHTCYSMSFTHIYSSYMWCIEGEAKNIDVAGEEVRDETEACIKSCENSAVFSSLPLAIKWLRDNAQQNHSVRFQVRVLYSRAFTCFRFQESTLFHLWTYRIYIASSGKKLLAHSNFSYNFSLDV